MAISNYTELKAAVATWAQSAALTDLIPDFIRLAELRISRDLFSRGMEVETELTTVALSRYVVAPVGMSKPLGLWLKDVSPRHIITPRLPSQMVVTTTSGYPEFWGIDGLNIVFDTPALSAWAFDFRYQTPFELSATVPTNYILTYYPDLYLFGALVEANVYMVNAEQGAVYDGRYSAALALAKNKENDYKSLMPLLTDFVSGSSYNIINGE